MNEETKPACSCQARIKEAINSTPSSGHDYVDEVLGLLRVTRSQRDTAEKMLLTRAGDRQSENAQNAGDIDGSSSATLLAAFDDALYQCPSLWMEIGYTRPTDWMVHVWDRTRKTDGGRIFTTQSTSRGEACAEATQKLREYLARRSS